MEYPHIVLSRTICQLANAREVSWNTYYHIWYIIRLERDYGTECLNLILIWTVLNQQNRDYHNVRRRHWRWWQCFGMLNFCHCIYFSFIYFYLIHQSVVLMNLCYLYITYYCIGSFYSEWIKIEITYNWKYNIYFQM